jgi:hypothetical protein
MYIDEHRRRSTPPYFHRRITHVQPHRPDDLGHQGLARRRLSAESDQIAASFGAVSRKPANPVRGLFSFCTATRQLHLDARRLLTETDTPAPQIPGGRGDARGLKDGPTVDRIATGEQEPWDQIRDRLAVAPGSRRLWPR